MKFWIAIVKVEVVGGGDCGRVEGGSTSSLSQRKRAQRKQPSAVTKLAAGSQWKSKLSQAESGLGQVTLACLRQRAPSDQNKDRRRDSGGQSTWSGTRTRTGIVED